MTDRLDEDLTAIGSLQDPVRRSLYRYVAGQRADVSRDEAATAVGVQRSLAAFHLDKLVEAGLLEPTFRRLTGRTGPGAGRPAKLYRRAPAERLVSVPPRQYDLAAHVLAEAVEEAGETRARESVISVAQRFGQRVGEELRASLGARASRDRRMAAIVDTLRRYGYEPRREGRAVRLSNCPFHSLSEEHRDLVCGMNQSLLQGVVDGMESPDLEARPETPQPGDCCVAVAINATPRTEA